jgi:hypothetical protein
MAATLDKDLTTTLKAARGGKPMQFAFLPKGSEGKLLIGKKISPKQIAETKKETGASSVFKGRCVGEDGTLVFYVAKEPPGTLLGQLRKRLKEDASVTYPIEIRVSSDAEAEPAEGEAAAAGAAAAPGTPASPRAAWEKALAAVEPAYLRGLRDQPDKASALRAVMGFAQGKAQKEDFAGAIAALRKLAEQLAKTPAGNGATLTTPPSPTPLADDGAQQRWERAATALEPGYLEALKRLPDKAGALRGVWAFAQGKAEAGDYDKALQALERIRGLLTAPAAPAGLAPGALAAWQAARDQVVAEIRKAAAAIAATRDPYARGAIIELQAVIKNLTPKPDTPQAVAELERYLQTDPVVTGVEDLPAAVATVRVRQPLLGALAALKA